MSTKLEDLFEQIQNLKCNPQSILPLANIVAALIEETQRIERKAASTEDIAIAAARAAQAAVAKLELK